MKSKEGIVPTAIRLVVKVLGTGVECAMAGTSGVEAAGNGYLRSRFTTTATRHLPKLKLMDNIASPEPVSSPKSFLIHKSIFQLNGVYPIGR